MKRYAAPAFSASEDKRARWEAGLDLDLDLAKDITDLQVENILRELSAPSSVQTQVRSIGIRYRSKERKKRQGIDELYSSLDLVTFTQKVFRCLSKN